MIYIYTYNIILYYIMEAGYGNPIQYSCLENSQGQRSLAGCTPQGHTDRLSTAQVYICVCVCVCVRSSDFVIQVSFFFPRCHPGSGRAFQVYLYFFTLIFCSMLSAAFSEVLTRATHVNVPDVSSSFQIRCERQRAAAVQICSHPSPACCPLEPS